jgi:hypothetical protein
MKGLKGKKVPENSLDILSKRHFAVHYDPKITERVNTIKNDTHYRETQQDGVVSK